jgi:hypothetical protein
LVDMNEVYVRIEAAHKEQPTIRLQQMKEMFRAKKGSCTHPTWGPYMDGPNVCRCQPRPLYVGAEDKKYVSKRDLLAGTNG